MSNAVYYWDFFLLCHLMNEEMGNIHSCNTFLFYAYSIPSTFLEVEVIKINKHNSSHQKGYLENNKCKIMET